jgi:HD-GYP domain-containing protein (c-di-GMP phosphodiesterase class II)
MLSRLEDNAPVDLWAALRGLSLALDLVMGLRVGHAQATAQLGLEIGQRLGLGEADRADIAMTALLKDAGCAASRGTFTASVGIDDIAFHRHVFGMDHYSPATFAALLWKLQRHQTDRATSRVKGWTHALLGLKAYQRQFAARNAEAARLAAELRCPVSAVGAIGSVGEHWDGSGNPGRLAGDRIPIAARVVLAAQMAVIWGETAGPADVSARLALQAGSRLDPTIVAALCALLAEQGSSHPGEWLDALTVELAFRASPLPGEQALTPPLLAGVFGDIVDAKSPFTAQHSHRVAALAGSIASLAGATPSQVEAVLLAGLLHDLGKLAVPNLVLDKNGPLSDPEWAIMRRHPADSRRVLLGIPGWEAIASWAGAHHERPDGRGYDIGRSGDAIPLIGRWLAVADAFDAMTADRPYRQGMDPTEALRRLQDGRESQFDGATVALLHAVVAERGAPLSVPGATPLTDALDAADLPFAAAPLGVTARRSISLPQ